MNKDVLGIIDRYIWKYCVRTNNDEYRDRYEYRNEFNFGEGLMFTKSYMYAFNYRPEFFVNKICHFDKETQYELPENYW